MGYYNPDVYYQPEEFGLKIVGEVDWSDGCYQYDITCVWQDEAGQFYVGRDAGCSCPSPFEYITGIDKLEKVSKFEVVERLEAELKEEQSHSWSGDNLDVKTADLIAKVMKAAA